MPKSGLKGFFWTGHPKKVLQTTSGQSKIVFFFRRAQIVENCDRNSVGLENVP